ncbi:MAG TPA: 7-carboxy-7-deazaguanine synthase [Bacteroidetes bacterium]|nr:7-carboxy-7-deazaguanine synthase [Bacteroidota bacterium]
MSQLVVNEIFHSIQGESSHAGRPCVFVRLTQCNLRCSYCDTEYAFHEGTSIGIAEIMQKVRSYGCRLVEITGGEPLMQNGVHELMKLLGDEAFEVLLETGGSLDISLVDSRVKRIMDLKTPGSRMAKKNLWTNIDHLRPGDEVKFVIGGQEDFDWSVETIKKYHLTDRCPVLMSVVFGVLEPVTLAQWILESNLNVRFQLQTHKYIWEPEVRGV